MLFRQRRVSVDFDGTLVMPAFPGLGELRPGARETLDLLRAEGWYVIISSCRTSSLFCPTEKIREERIRVIREALEILDIPYDEIDDGRSGKVVADVYIDDRAVSAICWADALAQTRSLGSFLSTKDKVCGCPSLKECRNAFEESAELSSE